MTDAEEKICQANKKRFEEHLLRKYPGVDKFNKGKATKDLSAIIPLDYLKKIVKHYRLLASVVKEKPRNPQRDVLRNFNDPLNFPSKEIEAIKRILTKLEKREWLQVFDADEAVSFIWKKMSASPMGHKRRRETTKSRALNRHGGRWPDFALNFVIFFLAEYAKEVTQSRPHYSDIADFLCLQDISPDHYDADALEKRHKRINQNKLWLFYNLIVIDFEGEWFDGLFQYRDIPEHLRADFRKSCVPEFVDFFPPGWKSKNLPT